MKIREYTVAEGDTLGLIAQREMGNEQLWPKLFEMNQGIIAAEQSRRLCDPDMRGPNWIFPGTVLRIYS